MLAILAKDGQQTPLDCDDYCIVHNWNGWEDTVKFSLPRGHTQLRLLAERTRLVEKTEGQLYAVTSINTGRNSTAFEAKLDLDSLCTGLLKNWNNYVKALFFSKGPQSMADTVRRALADAKISGWELTAPNTDTEKLAIDSFYGTALELVQKAVDVWKKYPVRFLVPETGTRQLRILDPGSRALCGAYFTDELNLLEQPCFKGKADPGDSYYTALYLAGKGCSVEVENHDYDPRVIRHYESDSSISDKNALTIKANAMVKAAAAPRRSYSCKVADLARLRPQRYKHLAFGLYDKVVLMDRDRGTNSTVQIAQYTVFPYCPESNTVQLNSVAGTISATSKSYSGDVVQYTDPDPETQEDENADP